MKTYKRRNIFFLFIIILSLFSIAFFNYKIDAYNIFSGQFCTSDTINFPSNKIYKLLKFHKKEKCSIFIIGSSEMSFFIQKDNTPNIQFFAKPCTLESLYKVLYAFLDMHPEVKTVLVSFSLCGSFSSNTLELGEYNGQDITFKDIISEVFSLDTTIKNIQKILRVDERNRIEKHNNKFFYIYPQNTIAKNYKLNINELNQSLYAIHKIKVLLEEKNIDVKYMITPISATGLSMMRHSPDYYTSVILLKRYIVNEVDELYDFSIINKYTKIHLMDKDNFIWNDFAHFRDTYGMKCFKVFFDKKNAENGLYTLLTKENIDEELEKQDKMIKEYSQQNKEKLIYHLDEDLMKKKLGNRPYITNDLKYLPKGLKNEMDYYWNNLERLQAL